MPEVSHKGFVIILLLWALRSSGGTFAPDTIDNWQIYNGKELILAGHESPLGTNFHSTIKRDDVGDLEIKFNHCSPLQNLTRTVRITDETGRTVVRKKLSNDTAKMIIHRPELGELNSKFLIVEYIERGKGGGLRRNLGYLIVQDSPEFNLGLFELKREDITEDYRAKIEAVRKRRGTFFEDDKFVADKTCSGEWGGTIRFRSKSTGEVRACSATCPIVINKVNGKYIVTNSLAHLHGSTEILEIAIPDSLSILPSPKPGAKKNGKVIKYVGDDESKSKKGVVQLLDSIGVLALGSFLHEDELLHVVTDYEKTYVAKIEHNRFVVVDIIVENLDTWTYEPEVLVTDDHHFITKIAGGYIDVFGKTITLLR